MAEAKTPEPVIENKENGAESKETAKDPKGDVVVDDKADVNKPGEVQVEKSPANGVDTVNEKLNEGKKVEQNEDLKEEKNEKDEVVEKNDIVAEEGKNSDTAKENDKGTETVEKEIGFDKPNAIEGKEAELEKPEHVEREEARSEKPDAVEGKEAESEKPDDVEGKQDEMEKPGDPEGKQDETEKPDDVDGKQDAIVDLNRESADVQESEKGDVEEKEPKKSGKGKSGTKKANEKSKDVQEPKTPAASSFSIDRPVRERKSVERLVAIIEIDSSREFHIEKVLMFMLSAGFSFVL